MTMFEDKFRRWLLDNGVSARDADLAAGRCARAVNDGAWNGAVAGAMLALKGGVPSAMFVAVLGFVAGGSVALGAADACRDVRAAAVAIARDALAGRPMPSARSRGVP